MSPTPTPPGPVTAGVDGGFEVRPAALRGAAGCFEVEADALDEVTARAVVHFTSTYGCWGDDEVGRRFGTRYEDAAVTVLGNLHAMSTGLAHLAAALRAVAAAYEGTDRLVASVEATS